MIKGNEKIYNHYLDNRKKIMTKTQFKVEDIFCDVNRQDSVSPEQINNINTFLAKLM